MLMLRRERLKAAVVSQTVNAAAGCAADYAGLCNILMLPRRKHVKF
jgi:hypothetical protein